MLLIHAPDDPHARYSRYLAEILRAEGFMGFEQGELDALRDDDLQRQRLVILPRLTPTPAQIERLLHYVRAGGRLLTVLPDARLAAALGLSPTHAARFNADLAIGTHADTQGLCREPVQVIVPAAVWRAPDDGATLAMVDDAPGVVHLRVGAGQAIAFAYDLAHSVARLRQGDPDNADINASGLDGHYRPSELFVGQMRKERLTTPQADVHTALLGRAIERLAPCPRVWYYPTPRQRSAMIMTSDDDWSTPEQFDTLLAGMREFGARCSFYIVPGTHLTRADMDALEQRDGHAFSAHPALESDWRDGARRDGEAQRHFVPRMLRENVERHRREFGRPVNTLRNHIVRWSGYVDAARALAGLGVAMDCNFLSVSPFSIGYMTGSGRPLRFVDEAGAILPVYQQATQWTEECLIHPEFVFSERWPVETAIAHVHALLDSAVGTHQTPVSLNSHPVSYATYSAPLVRAAWAAARERGVPIVSADEWLAWITRREAIAVSQSPAAAGAAWQLSAPPGKSGAVVLLPRGSSGEGVALQAWGEARTAVVLSAGEKKTVREEIS